jgi:hypothetical protein
MNYPKKQTITERDGDPLMKSRTRKWLVVGFVKKVIRLTREDKIYLQRLDAYAKGMLDTIALDKNKTDRPTNSLMK